MVVWFVALAAIGVHQHRATTPRCCHALNPWWGDAVLHRRTAGTAIFILGAVVLAVTGGEALYADMGHFGARPIRLRVVLASCCRR